MNKKIMSLLAIGALGLTALPTFAKPNIKNDDVMNALKNNNYQQYISLLTPTQEEFNQRRQRFLNQEAIRDAMDNNDYDAYLEAIENLNKNKTLTQEEFNIKVQAHNLMQEGDQEGAMELLKANNLVGNKRFNKQRHFAKNQ